MGLLENLCAQESLITLLEQNKHQIWTAYNVGPAKNEGLKGAIILLIEYTSFQKDKKW